MKREEIKSIFPDATKEQIDSVMSIYGAGIEQEKEKRKPIEDELASKNAAFDKLKTDFEALQEANAGAEDYKAKFEQLQKDIAEKEAAAKAETAEKEKAEKIAGRFNAALGEKKFSHEAIRADYLNRFAAALSDDANAGKSDADILHALTKDDAGAFTNVTAVKLAGGKQGDPGKDAEDAQARAVMGLPPVK